MAKQKILGRPKLPGTLTEQEQDDAVIDSHKAEESMNDIYHKLRARLGAMHPLTLKADRSRKRISNFKRDLRDALVG